MIILRYLILDISVNALLVSINMCNVLLNLSLLFIRCNSNIIMISIFLLIYSILIWFIDIILESLSGNLSELISNNLLLGFILFIISEIIIFSTIFFSYWYNIFIPSIFIGSIWTPIGVLNYNYNGIPLLNVLILFFAGITITSSLDYILNRKWCLIYLLISISLSIVFIIIQYIEFSLCKFTITDSYYGCIFFILTSLLGILMIFGTLFIIIAFIRLWYYLISLLNLICASINLLLLDILFIFIYIFIYCYN